MVYTLSNGALNYNSRLHYSLYGGVEYFPDNTLAFKELLPLAAIPAVAVTLLVAILNFHIPKISPQTGGGATGLSHSGAGTSLSIPASHAGTGSTSATTHSTASSTPASPGSQHSAASAAITVIPSNTVGPISSGSDNGQGIVGGRGGDGGTTTTTTDPSTTIGTSTAAGSASITTDATTQPAASQTTATASVPLTGTSLSVTVGL